MTVFAVHPAQARVWVGIGIPFPGYYVPPPVYYPPPAYYPPPPVYYAPPQPTYAQPPGQAAGGQQMCYAEGYSCPMEQPVASGASCYCRSNAGQKVWGHAN